MRYSKKAAQDLAEESSKVKKIRDDLRLHLIKVVARLRQEKAKEYLVHGVGRRIEILVRCLENIFLIFPPHRIERLDTDERHDLDINLHAFSINTAGVFDNLAWVFVYEHNLFGKENGKLGRQSIGLFKKETQAHFPKKFQAYLNTDEMKNWNSAYLKDFRDALAHRIPPYLASVAHDEEDSARYRALEDEIQKLDLSVPENLAAWDELFERQRELGTINLGFRHSVVESRRIPILHQQVLMDYRTVVECVHFFCDSLWPRSEPTPNLSSF